MSVLTLIPPTLSQIINPSEGIMLPQGSWLDGSCNSRFASLSCTYIVQFLTACGYQFSQLWCIVCVGSGKCSPNAFAFSYRFALKGFSSMFNTTPFKEMYFHDIVISYWIQCHIKLVFNFNQQYKKQITKFLHHFYEVLPEMQKKLKLK